MAKAKKPEAAGADGKFDGVFSLVKFWLSNW